MKILLATEKAFAPVAVTSMREVIESAGFKLELLENYKSNNDLIAAVADADGLIVRSDLVTSEVLDAATRLKIVIRAGAGYDNIDLEACTARKVIAMNTPGQNSNAVAELVFAMMLYQIRGGFNGKSGTELRGKSIGLHAFGHVGKLVAEIAKGFSMYVYAYDPFLPEAEIRKYGIKVLKRAEEMYKICHFVSLHLPYNNATKQTIGYDLITKIPAPATIINTARKEIIDEAGLIKAFEERPDLVYLSDVEPDCKAVFAEKFKGRYLFTAKKMGAQTEEANINAGVAAARQIVDYFNNGNETFKVNK
jgi:D-3-phosphoglycerate dehydrogenase